MNCELMKSAPLIYNHAKCALAWIAVKSTAGLNLPAALVYLVAACSVEAVVHLFRFRCVPGRWEPHRWASRS